MEQILSSTLSQDVIPIILTFQGKDGIKVTMPFDDKYPWLTPVIKDLEVIQGLSDGWNCGSGRATESDCVGTAFSLLNQLMKPEYSAPRIFPLPTGGLQLEWQKAELLLQVEIDPAEETGAYFRTEDFEDEFPIGPGDDLTIAPISERLRQAATPS